MQGPIEIINASASLAAPVHSARAVVHEALFPATPSELWPLWTTTDGITTWLVGTAKIELRLGGPYELHFVDEMPEGSRGSEGCRVLSFLPERMLSFTWNAPPHFEQRSAHTWVVVEFEPTEGGTQLRLTHLGWPEAGWSDGSTRPDVYVYFERAWGMVFAALKAHLER